MRTAIVGCGYVGMAVAHHWRTALGWEVTATTTTPARLAELAGVADRAVLLVGDDREGLTNLLADRDLVLLSVGAPSPLAYERTYLRTAEALATVIEKTPVRQVLYTSSYSVYGDRDGAWVDEETPPAPDTANGRILLATEQILLGIKRTVCILRLGGIYGPGRALVDIFGWAAGETLPGNGSDWGNWIHRDDIVGALSFAAAQELSGIYNLVGNAPLTRRELVEGVLAAHTLPPVQWDGAPPAGPRAYNARVRNGRIREAGYRLQRPTLDFVSER